MFGDTFTHMVKSVVGIENAAMHTPVATIGVVLRSHVLDNFANDSTVAINNASTPQHNQSLSTMDLRNGNVASHHTLHEGISRDVPLLPALSNYSSNVSNVNINININTTLNVKNKRQSHRNYNSTYPLKTHHYFMTHDGFSLRNYTLLLSVLDVNTARWKFVSSQLEHVYRSCQDSNVHLECLVVTNDRVLANSTSAAKRGILHTCSFQYVAGKISRQILQIPLVEFTAFDFVGVMIADTSTRPHRGNKQRAAYNNLHIPSFLATMHGMGYDQTSASILNHQLFPFMRPKQECISRSALFADIQFSIYTYRAFQCFQRHVSAHVGENQGDLMAFAIVFHVVCNATVGIMDHQHIGKLTPFLICIPPSLFAIHVCRSKYHTVYYYY
jgi:hypothetical protein